MLHVLPDRLPQRVRADAEKHGRAQLEQAIRATSRAVATFGRRDIEVVPSSCTGPAYIEIIRHARSAGVDLIVLGRHGRRAVRDMFIGSTASRVIRKAGIPVLVVTRRSGKGYRRPLVAVDLEDTSRAVVDLALRVVGPETASVVLAHAYRVPFEGFLTPGALPEDVTAYRKEYQRLATANLARLVASLGGRGIEWQTCVRRGDPRSVILGEAARRRSDLVVIGTHGRSGLAHALVGSVAEGILENATVDVLVARPARVSFELP